MIKRPIQQEDITIHNGYVSLESQLLHTELQNIQIQTEGKGEIDNLQ